MRLFRRDDPATVPTATAAPDLEPGTLPCSHTSCSATTGAACAYVDRRSRPCPTAWCPDHRATVEGRTYCRRHAGIVAALAGDARVPLPDLENRAPSLVEWVGRDLDAAVQDALARRHSRERLVVEPVRLVFLGPERLRVWERTWKLCAHTGFAAKVAIQVEEDHDTDVVVKVGPTAVARLTPPWIEHRRRGEIPTPEDDAARRGAFYRDLAETVAQSLAAQVPAAS